MLTHKLRSKSDVLDVLSRRPNVLSHTGSSVRLGFLVLRTRHTLMVEITDLFDRQGYKTLFYDEEGTLDLFVKTNYLSVNELYEDVKAVYECQLQMKSLTDAILSLKQHLLDTCVLHEYILMNITMLPVHPTITQCICQFGSFLSRQKRKSPLIDMLYKPVDVSNEKEWKVVVHFRSLCGLHWVKKPPKSDRVEVHHGTCSWTFTWHSVATRHENTYFYERLDERLQWVALWFAYARRYPSIIQASPKVFPVALALLTKEKCKQQR